MAKGKSKQYYASSVISIPRWELIFSWVLKGIVMLTAVAAFITGDIPLGIWV